ncbi:hypothetical protein [Streptomyces sp. MJP52]|uniref:hypothetical protein n=1 Tax=Streptomyces sp. MJP52 TaxID=2940555 RepID=UPI0024756D38|nr:hypothetical protein [Streptomyces sp. MJP52]MDH6227843.1 hypothetical protein [Streptomyces sp. MJP52]
MATESHAVDAEERRRLELARRAETRRLRETGAIPPLRRRRAATNAAVPATAPPPGGEPVRLPDRALAVLNRVAETFGIPDFTGEVMRRAASSAHPHAVVGLEVLALLEDARPLTALRHLLDLTASGVEVLTERDRMRAEALTSGRLPLPELRPGTVDAWQLHLEAVEATAQHATLPSDTWRRLVERLPLPALDDILDRPRIPSGLTPHLWPEWTDRVRHVVARVDPRALGDEDVTALGWRDEEARRVLEAGGTVEPPDGRHDAWSIRSALLNGEASVLDEIGPSVERNLPSDLLDLIDSLRDIRRGGAVDARLGHERSLFGLIEDCLGESRVVSGRTPFHHWAGTRRMYRLLDRLHWCMACEPEGVEAAVNAVLQQAATLRNQAVGGLAAGADREARVVQAYLHFLFARTGEHHRLDQAVGLLEDVLKRGGPERGGAPRALRRRIQTLSELLQALRAKSKPREVLNPYLALCVEHGSQEWRWGWRTLRNQVATEQLEYVNGVKDRIRRAETALRLEAEPEIFYALPLDEDLLWVPRERNRVLLPDLERMPRTTAPATAEERQWTGDEAAREIIGRSAERLRNDH